MNIIEDAINAKSEQAYSQLGSNSEHNGYRYDIPTLFNYNAFLVISDGVSSKVGTLTSKIDRYNEKLLDCFLWFNNKVESIIDSKEKKKEFIVSLKDKLINSEIIEIIVEKDVDGYRVFETLNARGIPLEQHELIKNYLYSYLRKKLKHKN